MMVEICLITVSVVLCVISIINLYNEDKNQ